MHICMQYTIRNIPASVDAALRRQAKRQGKTLNEVAVAAIAEGLGVSVEHSRRRSVRDILGACPRDEQLDASLEDQRQIDPDLWR